MKKVYLDTNIFLDYFNTERVYHNEAKQLMRYLITNDIQIVFSEERLLCYLHHG
ncbi:PIN domain protein [Campylobacter upsaliensis]|nr:PIN domain protein [Campylobacter upsaliensis]